MGVFNIKSWPMGQLSPQTTLSSRFTPVAHIDAPLRQSALKRVPGLLSRYAVRPQGLAGVRPVVTVCMSVAGGVFYPQVE